MVYDIAFYSRGKDLFFGKEGQGIAFSSDNNRSFIEECMKLGARFKTEISGKSAEFLLYSNSLNCFYVAKVGPEPNWYGGGVNNRLIQLMIPQTSNVLDKEQVLGDYSKFLIGYEEYYSRYFEKENGEYHRKAVTLEPVEVPCIYSENMIRELVSMYFDEKELAVFISKILGVVLGQDAQLLIVPPKKMILQKGLSNSARDLIYIATCLISGFGDKYGEYIKKITYAVNTHDNVGLARFVFSEEEQLIDNSINLNSLKSFSGLDVFLELSHRMFESLDSYRELMSSLIQGIDPSNITIQSINKAYYSSKLDESDVITIEEIEKGYNRNIDGVIAMASTSSDTREFLMENIRKFEKLPNADGLWTNVIVKALSCNEHMEDGLLLQNAQIILKDILSYDWESFSIKKDALPFEMRKTICRGIFSEDLIDNKIYGLKTEGVLRFIQEYGYAVTRKDQLEKVMKKAISVYFDFENVERTYVSNYFIEYGLKEEWYSLIQKNIIYRMNEDFGFILTEISEMENGLSDLYFETIFDVFKNYSRDLFNENISTFDVWIDMKRTEISNELINKYDDYVLEVKNNEVIDGWKKSSVEDLLLLCASPDREDGEFISINEEVIGDIIVDKLNDEEISDDLIKRVCGLANDPASVVSAGLLNRIIVTTWNKTKSVHHKVYFCAGINRKEYSVWDILNLEKDDMGDYFYEVCEVIHNNPIYSKQADIENYSDTDDRYKCFLFNTWYAFMYGESVSILSNIKDNFGNYIDFSKRIIERLYQEYLKKDIQDIDFNVCIKFIEITQLSSNRLFGGDRISVELRENLYRRIEDNDFYRFIVENDISEDVIEKHLVFDEDIVNVKRMIDEIKMSERINSLLNSSATMNKREWMKKAKDLLAKCNEVYSTADYQRSSYVTSLNNRINKNNKDDSDEKIKELEKDKADLEDQLSKANAAIELLKLEKEQLIKEREEALQQVQNGLEDKGKANQQPKESDDKLSELKAANERDGDIPIQTENLKKTDGKQVVFNKVEAEIDCADHKEEELEELIEELIEKGLINKNGTYIQKPSGKLGRLISREVLYKEQMKKSIDGIREVLTQLKNEILDNEDGKDGNK